jgi:multicomponent Na+:H+ antiporter subunit E
MSSTTSRHVVRRTAALFAVWLVLSQTLEPFYLGLGFATALTVALLNRAHSVSGRVRWMRLAAYVPWLVWQVLLSGRHLTYLILHPRLPIEPKLVRYQMALQDPAAVVLFGNSITLTPGTITAEVASGELVIHAMDDAAAAGLREMEQRIANVFDDAGARETAQ